MPTIQDSLLQQLRTLGYSGSVNDMFRQYLIANIENSNVFDDLFTNNDTINVDLNEQFQGAGVALVPYPDATALSAQSGDWSAPTTWVGGVVPTVGSNVVVAENHIVNYDITSAIDFGWIRVDGTLKFQENANTRMSFVHMICTPNSRLEIGTADTPITGSVDLMIQNRGDMDPVADPTMVGRTIMTMGVVRMQGQRKSTHAEILNYPTAGTSTITLDRVPTNWQVGDQIVVTGTNYEGYNQQRVFQGHEDEEKTISSLVGTALTLDSPLVYDKNDGEPGGPLVNATRPGFNGYVVNYSRNIVIRTEDGETAPYWRKGHTMFMNPDVVATSVEFRHLGRTDKSFFSANLIEVQQMEFDTNLQGRYPVHVHRTGFDERAVLDNLSVWTSPGIGITHHSSWVDILNCVTYDCYGAGMFAEIGDEIGDWDNNVNVFCQGREWSTSKIVKHYTAPGERTNAAAYFLNDNASAGCGMFFRGRAVKVRNNISVSCNEGFTWLLRGNSPDPDENDQIALARLDDFIGNNNIKRVNVDFDEVPIYYFSGNTTLASRAAMFIEKTSAIARQPLASHFTNFNSYNCRTAVQIAYIGIYLFKGGRAVNRGGGACFNLSSNVYSVYVSDWWFENAERGLFYNLFTTNELPITPAEFKLEEFNNNFIDVLIPRENFDNVTPTGQTFNIALNPVVYNATTRTAPVSGTQTDSLGVTTIPPREISGPNEFTIDFTGIITLVRDQVGYWIDPNDNREYTTTTYMFSDRNTLEDFRYRYHISTDPGNFSAVNFFDGAVNNGTLAQLQADFPEGLVRRPDAFEDADWSLVPAIDSFNIVINSLPNSGLETITDIEYRVDNGPWTSSGGTTSFTISGLTTGVHYWVQIRPKVGDLDGPPTLWFESIPL